MGKSNYYDKMEWQDSIKVIITQKLHQIRNWEFHNMLYGMSTIEIIENLIIENLTENRVIRRFGWPPTIFERANQLLNVLVTHFWVTHENIGKCLSIHRNWSRSSIGWGVICDLELGNFFFKFQIWGRPTRKRLALLGRFLVGLLSKFKSLNVHNIGF